MIKKMLVIVVFFLCAQSAWGQEEPVAVDGVVARVNRDIITLSAYRRAQQEMRSELQQQLSGQQLEEQYQRGLKDLLQQLVDTQLLVQKADELGITVEAEINSYLIEVAKQNNVPPSQIDGMLQKMGLDPDQARQMLRMRFLRERVIGREVYPKIFQNIFDKDVEAYYKEHLEQYTEPSAVKVSEILIKNDKRGHDQAAELIQKMMVQLNGGADFAELARKHSEGPTASAGGDLGWFNLDPRPELGEVQRKAIEGKQAGQAADPFELPDGFRILRLDERREKKERPLTPELRREVSMRIAQHRAQPAIDEFIKKLRGDAFIQIAEPYRPTVEATKNP
jgi:peptidyl-prolyl cis-trans isomerase SurA